MLKLINVCKGFKFGKEKYLVLNNININFKNKELVFILGKSGSGKSTLLNIIGGLLEVDSGNVMLDDNDITKFNNTMLCNYRNNMIGYIFQDYHLIEYMSVIDNIKLGQTVYNKNNNKINEILKKLNIYNKRIVKVNKLSGGEKQRVAIARAIINEPDIILCDEPTGALDTENGILVMDILKELSKEKLVIVVSHDKNLAEKYADRIINIRDGKIECNSCFEDVRFKEIKNSKINVVSLIKLAVKNLSLKKGRTLFTSLAISIGILCMLIVLCLSRSFNDDINRLERDIVSKFPISVYNGEIEVDNDNINSSNDKIIIKNKNDYIHTNKISNEYLNYLNNIDEIKYISYYYDISMPVISDRYLELDNNYMRMVPDREFILNNFDVLYGKMSESIYEIVLKVDSNNNVSSELLNVFDINNDIDYQELIGRELRVILNDLYYVKDREYYYINKDNKMLYNNSEISLKIVGIVREKEIVDDNSYFFYNMSLIDYIVDKNSNSKIVLEQLKNDNNLLGLDIEKMEILSYLGYNTLPSGLDIYVSDIEDKNIVLSRLDKYSGIIYVDTMKDAIDILKNVINIITIVLVLFSLISIFISSLMIFILTNNRVMERIKEIGILKSIGAKNRDVTKLFNIENLIIGFISSIIGIVFLFCLEKPINSFIGMLLLDNGMFNIYSEIVLITLIFNIFIVVLSGYIPSVIASRKRIVDCMNNRF